ncbi:MAG TPA: SPFH domain-containing protein [Coxiellaceae bacterium]|nr:MAG: protease [Gammaproteobacteria bacterium RIFCSPHIGHO2_12_FULL_36_30]HLB56309.1 SPFH domain-containing protein [Coxiellaceae bacterium]
MPILIAAVAIFLLFIFSLFFTVQQQTTAIVERFGKYVRASGAGLHTKWPLIERVASRINMRVQQLDVVVETKTKDNVFVKIAVSAQFQVLHDKIYEAFYKLEDPNQQIRSFIFDSVRARVPKMILDDVFEKKEEIADCVKLELSEIMANFGYGIVNTLVTDIDPDAKVKAAMNEINEAQRLQVAAQARGEAEKILKVKKAEAEAESTALQGQGLANQRKAIINGLRESIAAFQQSVQNASEIDIMSIVMLTQYFDTIKELGASGNANTILLPHSPSSVNDFMSQIRDSFIVGNQVKSAQQTVAKN